MIGIDTNVLVRYITQDDPVQAALARRFVERTISPERRGHVSLVVLAELVWVLRTRYGASRGEIACAVEELLADPRLCVQEEDAVWRAVDEYDLEGVDFADALIAAIDREQGCTHTVTFDKAAPKIAGMTLLQ